MWINLFPEIRAMLKQPNLSHLYNRVRTLSASLAARLRGLAITAAAGLLCTLAVANPPCPSDLDGDGMVTGADISLVLLDFGACSVDPPSISAVSPAFGPTAGGTTITITGTALTDTSSVTVRGNTATSVVVVNDTTVTAVTPPGSVGAANVQVTTPGGTATLNGGFTYGIASPPPSWCTVLEQTPNATVVPDATVRANIVATGFPWRVLDKGTGIEMLLVPPDTFTMGCSPYDAGTCSNNEDPTHQVTLTKAFYLGKTEVTQKQWQDKMGYNPSYFQNISDSPSRPVEQVSWNEIHDFCDYTGLRLPSEAEWEYACRGDTTTAIHSTPERPNGSKIEQLDSIAWYGNAFGHTHAVAGLAPNAFGFYDMSGNVSEWCNDWYGDYSAGHATDPTGPSSGSDHVQRGGGYYGSAHICRSSARGHEPIIYSWHGVGFRVARTP
jgi:formylglycine-generating enzyme required for sulfatase activity